MAGRAHALHVPMLFGSSLVMCAFVISDADIVLTLIVSPVVLLAVVPASEMSSLSVSLDETRARS
jgi:hypothetical protein